jgi:hypothetical protein
MSYDSGAFPISPKYAENFPPGYGDFVFQSSDGVIFHFPQFLLSFTSPVFKDMYDMSGNAANGEILKLTEDSEALDLLLHFIDPSKESPPLIWETVGKFIDAADKYQVKGVLSWFQKEAELEGLKNHHIEKPVVCLELASRLKFNNLVCLAVRDLIKVQMDFLKFHPGENVHLVSRIYELRTNRAIKLAEAIQKVYVHTSKQLMNQSCNLHGEARCRFDIVDAIQLAISCPSWEQTKYYLDYCSDGACICMHPIIPPALEDEMQALENKIPEL